MKTEAQKGKVTFQGLLPARQRQVLSCQTESSCHPPPPPHPADLRDGVGHLSEVLVPAGHMPPGVVTDTGLWAALGSCVPSWAQGQQQKQQQDRGDALGTGRKRESPCSQGPGSHIVHSRSPGSGPLAPGKVSYPLTPPPRSRGSVVSLALCWRILRLRGVTWHLPLVVSPVGTKALLNP